MRVVRTSVYCVVPLGNSRIVTELSGTDDKKPARGGLVVTLA